MKMAYKSHNDTIKIPDDWVELDDYLTAEEFKKKNKL